MSVNDQKWYPKQSASLNYEQWNAHRITLDKVYELEEQIRKLHGRHGELLSKMDGMKKENSKLKEIINNRLAGRLVKPTNPSNGDTVRFNTTSGQFEFGP